MRSNVEDIVRQAGDYLLSHFGKQNPQHLKNGTHYDTKHDKIASDIYKHFLLKKFPDIGFYSEEDKLDISQYQSYWLIDSIEGTTNYARNIPLFATQIALIHTKQIVLGCVYLPIQQELYYAEKGKGATCNHKSIQVGKIPTLEKSVISINKGTGRDNLAWWAQTASLLSPKSRTIRLLGATGIELCYVASGKLDLHVNQGSQPYDYAPGALIAKESGASILNHFGHYWSLQDSAIIVGNNLLVKETLNFIKQ